MKWINQTIKTVFLLLFLVACRHEQQPPVKVVVPRNGGGTENTTPAPTGKVPGYVLETLQYIRQHNEAPDGYVGGRVFQNREKKLPLKSGSGAKVQYREWDVYPKVQGRNRGAERLVTGSDQSAWYTSDHYKHFTKIE